MGYALIGMESTVWCDITAQPQQLNVSDYIKYIAYIFMYKNDMANKQYPLLLVIYQ